MSTSLILVVPLTIPGPQPNKAQIRASSCFNWLASSFGFEVAAKPSNVPHATRGTGGAKTTSCPEQLLLRRSLLCQCPGDRGHSSHGRNRMRRNTSETQFGYQSDSQSQSQSNTMRLSVDEIHERYNDVYQFSHVHLTRRRASQRLGAHEPRSSHPKRWEELVDCEEDEGSERAKPNKKRYGCAYLLVGQF